MWICILHTQTPWGSAHTAYVDPHKHTQPMRVRTNIHSPCGSAHTHIAHVRISNKYLYTVRHQLSLFYCSDFISHPTVCRGTSVGAPAIDPFWRPLPPSPPRDCGAAATSPRTRRLGTRWPPMMQRSSQSLFPPASLSMRMWRPFFNRPQRWVGVV